MILWEGELKWLFKPRNASAFSVGCTRLIAVSKEKFNIMIKNPGLSSILIRLMESICERIWVSSQQLLDSSMKSPIDKIFCTLYTEYSRARSLEKEKFIFEFGVDKLLEFVDLQDRSDNLDSDFYNGKVFCMGELLRRIGLKDFPNSNDILPEAKIFTVLDGRLACLNIPFLKKSRDKLVNAVIKN